MNPPTTFETDPLPLPAKLLVALARHWPIDRGRTRLRQLVARSLAGRKPFVRVRLAESSLSVLAPWADQLGNIIVTFGDNEPDVFRLLCCCMHHRPSGLDLFVDVGANLGVFSLRIAERFGDLNVLAFEPNPAIAVLLRENIDLNGLATRVTMRQVALGNHDGSMRLDTVQGDSGASKVSANSEVGVAIEMRQMTSEFPVTEWKRVPVIKIDVEGFELDVFEGARPLFEQHRPVVIYEVNRPELLERGQAPDAPGNFLRSVGYQRLLALDEVLYPPENGLYEVTNIAAFPPGSESLIDDYGFSERFAPRPRRMWPVGHFKI